MLCQDTKGEMPAVHISQEAFHVAREYEECSQVLRLLRVHDWSITFRTQGNNMPSAKVEFLKVFHKIKEFLAN